MKRDKNKRNKNLVVRLHADELEMMHAIVGAEREPAAALVRRWIRQHAEAIGMAVTGRPAAAR